MDWTRPSRKALCQRVSGLIRSAEGCNFVIRRLVCSSLTVAAGVAIVRLLETYKVYVAAVCG